MKWLSMILCVESKVDGRRYYWMDGYNNLQEEKDYKIG